MIIRKLYKIESAHIVRDAYSRRCSHSYHGHSGVIEVFLKSQDLDKAGMIYDFGALKDTVGSFIDMFDHSVHLWVKDKPENIEFFMKNNERYIVLPCNPTAENYSILFRDCINEILNKTQSYEGSVPVKCVGVRYHETSTGYAESEWDDPIKYYLEDLYFSPKTREETSDKIKELLNEDEEKENAYK